jgi:mono/diheme cytochrome c family protein
MRRAQKALCALIAVCGAIAVSTGAAWSFPWSIDMYRGEAVQPLSRAPRVTPEDTMPVDHGEPPMTLEAMTVKMKNPYTATPKDLAHGKELFMNNCAPCHGENATGNGPVAHLLHDPPKNLVSGTSKDLPDGYIYGVIRDGILLMPSYDDAMSAHERWDVVMYVRSLQQSANATSKTASK